MRRLLVLGASAAGLLALLLTSGPASAVVAAPTRSPSAALLDGFHGSSLDDDRWIHWWGTARTRKGWLTLESRAPQSASETFSALVTTRRAWKDFALELDAMTMRQLRRGDHPNTWEVAWVIFRFRDLENYYYFILKPNGVELGKKHGSDDQIFLATGESPRLELRSRDRLRITAKGARVRVWVNGDEVIDYVDPKPLRSGSIGLYEEDAAVRFDSMRVRRLPA